MSASLPLPPATSPVALTGASDYGTAIRKQPRSRRSPLRDRRFDMRLETRALAQPVMPGAQIVERRPLDRKGEPAIDLGAEHDFGEAQLGAGEIGLVVELVVDNGPGRQGPPPRGVDRGGVARFRLGANEAEQQLTHRPPASRRQ